MITNVEEFGASRDLSQSRKEPDYPIRSWINGESTARRKGTEAWSVPLADEG
jgi:hypothetical protein